MSNLMIKGKCKCGRCTWEAEMQRDGEMWYHWVLSGVYYTTTDDIGELNYCPVCGCQLAGDGFAYKTVRADSVASWLRQSLAWLEDVFIEGKNDQGYPSEEMLHFDLGVFIMDFEQWLEDGVAERNR